MQAVRRGSRPAEAARGGASRVRAPDLDNDNESTIALCRFDEPAKASLLGLELEQAGLPYWVRPAPLDPILDLAGIPKLIEFRVPAKYLEEARSALRRVEERERGQPMNDVDAEE